MNLSIRFMKNRFFFLVVIAFVSLLFSSCHKDRAEYYIFFHYGDSGRLYYGESEKVAEVYDYIEDVLVKDFKNKYGYLFGHSWSEVSFEESLNDDKACTKFESVLADLKKLEDRANELISSLDGSGETGDFVICHVLELRCNSSAHRHDSRTIREYRFRVAYKYPSD